MSCVINVPDTDSFDLWRQKTNLIAQQIGCLDDLLTTDKSDLVSAINEVITIIEEKDRDVLIRAIAMS